MTVKSRAAVVFDRHDAALYVWRDARVRGAVLLHIDAHPDAHAGLEGFVEIGNFIWHAVREGILSRVFWAVPDPSWASRAIRRDLVRAALELSEGAGATQAAHGIETAVCGRPFTIGPLAAFQAGAGDVLLDIDVDYCLIPDVRTARPPARDPWPWMWPRELVAAVRQRGVQPVVTTIATSVTGGYTPARWKHFGDEMRTRLLEDTRAAATFDILERGIRLLRTGDAAGAEAAYREATGRDADAAAAWYWLAQVLIDRGAVRDAQDAYARVLALDSEYRTAFSDGRALQFRTRDRAAARAAFERGLTLDPGDGYACLGLGQLAVARRAWSEAIGFLDRAVQLEPELVDAHRALARALEGAGRRADAIRAYDHSLRLALTGGRSIGAPVTSRPFGTHDPQHPDVHARIAWLQTREGIGDPVAACRMALRGAPDRLDVQGLLIWHYVRRRRWRAALRQLASAAGHAPIAASLAFNRARRRVQFLLGRPA